MTKPSRSFEKGQDAISGGHCLFESAPMLLKDATQRGAKDASVPPVMTMSALFNLIQFKASRIESRPLAQAVESLFALPLRFHMIPICPDGAFGIIRMIVLTPIFFCPLFKSVVWSLPMVVTPPTPLATKVETLVVSSFERSNFEFSSASFAPTIANCETLSISFCIVFKSFGSLKYFSGRKFLISPPIFISMPSQSLLCAKLNVLIPLFPAFKFSQNSFFPIPTLVIGPIPVNTTLLPSISKLYYTKSTVLSFSDLHFIFFRFKHIFYMITDLHGKFSSFKTIEINCC